MPRNPSTRPAPILSEMEWRDIKNRSKLPDAARPEIEQIIAVSGKSQINPWTARLKDARNSVVRARATLRAAEVGLKNLLASEAPSFMQEVSGNGRYDGYIIKHRPKIEAAFNAVTEALKVLPDGLEDKIPRAPQGRLFGGTRTTVIRLDALLNKHLGKGLDQSKKMLELSRLIVSKAKPNITTAAVRDHVKALPRRPRRGG